MKMDSFNARLRTKMDSKILSKASKKFPNLLSTLHFLGDLYGLEKFWAFLKYYKVRYVFAAVS